MTAPPRLRPMLFEPPAPFPRALVPHIKAVGRGARLARSLSREEAREAMGTILAGGASAAQIGAFFQAQRIKTESPEELAGFIEAARGACDCAPAAGRSARVEAGLPYDGRLRAFHVMPAAALLAARAGVETFFHGSAGVGPKFGVNAVEVLAALGFAPSRSNADAEAALAARGAAYRLQRDYSPAIAALRPLRDEVILRGPLATVEKMLNLSGAGALIVGVTHTPYVALSCAAFAPLLAGWGGARAWIVQAPEGHADPDPGRATAYAAQGPEPARAEAESANVNQGEGSATATAGAASPPLERFPPLAAESGAGGKAELLPPAPPAIDPLDPAERARWIDANAAWCEAALEGREERGRAALLASAALLLLAARKESDYPAALASARMLLET